MPCTPATSRLRAVALIFGLFASVAAPCFAEEAQATGGTRADGGAAKRAGKPKVTLDRLVLPAGVAESDALEQHLRRVLKREARRADWGAGRGSRIEYRFIVSELGIKNDGHVLRVRCTAFGQLPAGRRAKSHLAYGGDPAKRQDVVKRVLEIVARGVITRLAELERVRRGELDPSRVRAPSSVDVPE
jgi:hypothetical protein